MKAALLSMCVLLCGCPMGRESEEDLAGQDQGGPDLAGVDLQPMAPFAFLDLDTIYQDCMPPARPDPLLLKGRLTLRNQSALPIGPITAQEGLIFNQAGARLATFQLVDPMLGTLEPNGAVEGKVVDKAAGTLMPATGCSSVPCAQSVRIEVELSGKNLPAGSKAKSANYMVVCAF